MSTSKEMINPKLQYISNILKILLFKGSDLALLDRPDKLLTGALVDSEWGKIKFMWEINWDKLVYFSKIYNGVSIKRTSACKWLSLCYLLHQLAFIKSFGEGNKVVDSFEYI